MMTDDSISESDTWRSPLMRWLMRVSLARVVVAVLVIALLLSIATTYTMLTQNTAEASPNAHSVMALILITLILLLGFVALVSSRIVRLWVALRKGSLGSRLQTRVVAMFCIVTIVPTVIVSVFSAVFFNFGIQSWFDTRVSTALEESVAVAQSYLNEHKEVIRADAIAMANDLDRESHYMITNPSSFNNIVSTQAMLRSLSEAIVIQRNRIIAQTKLSFSITFERIPLDVLERASRGEAVVMLEGEDNVRALVKLASMPDTFLLVGRLVDSKVINHMQSATGGVNEYRRLKANISKLQIQFSAIFVLVALLLLMAAIWYGLHFASRLLNPISRLVSAAERVRAGDFSAKVMEGPKDDEVGTLSRAFNRMTDELEQQRMELIEANRQIDSRRRFSEAVLAGVSAGVIALDAKLHISHANPAAEQLLGLGSDDRNRSILEVLPQLRDIVNEAQKQKKLVQGDVSMPVNQKPRTFHIRITTETFRDIVEGFIVTFDDITELLVAQRNAAWADVARRVAHEIKNPLTPISLAAERLKKKYLSQITEEPENFSKYVDTISKNVGDIGKMVEEFVSFARMPAPEFKQEDIVSVIRKVLFSEQIAHADIQYTSALPKSPVTVLCDERQISQVFINLLKNAAEAIEGREQKTPQGIIHLSIEQKESSVKIIIRDNGPGFPSDKIQKLMEPYFTTRARGTGLGLAIVKKIIDDHKATLALENAPEGGAIIRLNFSIDSGNNVT